jgi:tRNA-Thr(GGU) m(6)t(6)A37 methyltransferase TsaA
MSVKSRTGEGRRFVLKPIGIVHSPFREPTDIPRDMNRLPGAFAKVCGELEIFPEYAEGLKDVGAFSHLIVTFAFHKSTEAKLLSKPPGETRLRGVFSTRSPHRPNALGLTVVKFASRKGNILGVSGIDMVEGTPILDIKPYTARDRKSGIRTGWIRRRRVPAPPRAKR